MSHYCKGCFYEKNKKTGPRSCPFNSLYWNFYDLHSDKLEKNPRIGMMYKVWNRMPNEQKEATLKQAEYYLENINQL
jgi:deoxyribodipyrimidine photolyase-related protein